MYDAIVIGGGLLGIATAYHLARDGVKVLLVDQGHPGRATDAGAGILSPETSSREADAWVQLAVRAVAYYPALVADLESQDAGETGYARCGLLVVAATEDETRAIRGREGADLRAARPGRQPLGGRSSAGIARGRAPDVSAARVRAGRAVLPARGPRGWPAAVTGAPARGEAPGADRDARKTGWPIVSAFHGHYMVPWPDGRVVVGATRETGSGFDPRLTAAGVREVLHEALRVAPGLAAWEIQEMRVGLRPLTRDELPILGPVPGVEGIYLATGHGPTGLQLGPYSGKLTADLMLGRQPEMDLAPFSVRRFRG